MRFQRLIDADRDALIAALQGCIRIPSVYADDDTPWPYGQAVHDCLHYVLELGQTLGFDTCNLDEQVGWCEFGRGEEMVAVLGHLDVVPEGEGWSVPPYEGLVRDGRIYGRGTMDDKGPTIAALFALKAIRDSGLPLKRRIRVLFGLNEETGSADMKYYAAHGGEIPVMGFTPDGEYPVINGEKGLVTEHFRCDYTPEGALRVRTLWGGTAHNIVPDRAWAELDCPPDMAAAILTQTAEQIAINPTETGVRIEAAGVNAHGGSPWEGENAIGRLVQFLAQLPFEGQLREVFALLSDKLGMEWDGASLGIATEDALSGKLSMNLGVLRGDGDSIEVKLNYRYPVTHTFEECGPQVKAAMESVGFAQTFLQHKQRIYMAEDSELVQKLLKVYRDCTGDQSARPKTLGGGTYAKMMPNVLAFGPIFPGDEVREHKPDEFMELSRLIDNANILAEAMYALAAE